ncbi:hypothetical protein ETAA8_02130 [Anatilimnocola aggregata]|uniref:Lnb N-terminal periplasmic domain-containing protein n=1 Tax=Anatilimnocola aggregata TaxID=2528021 RepID=A0A517Y4H1_9BACT|nr:DUF4105 domain-containing protein [Anatilimnocola aggregata]QDU25151.1 hypothetical protein ETAA8_02130 [Anatilimnocola aggregata]
MPSPLISSNVAQPASRCLVVGAILLVTALAGCKNGPAAANGTAPLELPTITTASNDRNWIIEHRVLADAKMAGDQITIHNVRDAEFFTYRDCVVDYYDKTFKLGDVQNVDYLVVPFNEQRALAHTMLSFGLADGDRVGVSVEVRLEQGEEYHPATGLLGQFELIYVVASERDLIRVRTEHRKCDVYAYRGNSTPEQTQALLVDILRRVNQLRTKPELYDSISNNCTTNIVQHINKLAPGKIPQDYRVLLPGFSDQLAYELKLIDTTLPFEETKRRARVNDLALKYRDDPNFSARIRGERIAR